MNHLLFLFILGLITISATEITEFEEEDNQLLLDSSNFLTAVSQIQFLFVYFYSEDCQTCDQFYSSYHSIIPHEIIKFTSIDINDEPSLQQKYSIKEVPKALLFIKGYPIEFPNNASSIPQPPGWVMNKWLKKKVEFSTEPIRTLGSLDFFLKDIKPNQVKVLFIGEKQSQEFQNLLIFLRRFEVIYVGHVFHEFESYKFIEEKFNYSETQSTIFLIRGSQFNENFVSLYPTSLTIDNLETIFNDYSEPLIWQLDDFATHFLFGQNKPFMVLFNCGEECKENTIEFEKICTELKANDSKKLRFVISESNTSHESKAFLEHLGIDPTKLPQIWIINPNGLYRPVREWERFRLRSKKIFDFETVRNFLNSWEDKQLKIEIKQAEIIGSGVDEYGIMNLVSESYLQVVQQKDYHLVILYYLQDNEICKNYQKVFNPIAKRVNNKYPNIKFARFDSSTNEFLKLEGLAEPLGMPTVWAFQKNSIKQRELETYKNNKEGLLQFLEEVFKIEIEREEGDSEQEIDQIKEQMLRQENSLKTDL